MLVLAPVQNIVSGSSAAIVRPTFSRDFAGEKTLDNGTGPNITFTRNSNATFFDATGTLQTAGSNVPRFDHDPATGASRGLLIEEARTNSMIRSAEFDDAAWNKAGTTVTANSATAPDGTTTADTLSSSNATATMAINNTPQVAYAAGTYTWSWFVKTNGWQWVQLRSSASLSSAYANFDIVNGIVGTASGATATLSNIGSGWFRISVSFAAAAATGDWALNLVSATDSGRNSSTTGNGTDGIFIWGAQLEAGAFATSYIPTTTAAATRAADSVVVTPISSFYNQTEGSFYGEWSVLAAQNTQTVFSANAASGGGATAMFVVNENGNANGFIENGRISGPSSFISRSKAAIAFARNAGGTLAVDGTIYTSTTVNQISTIVTLQLGGLVGSTTRFLNGHIRKIAYWPKRLTNTLLQQLTT